METDTGESPVSLETDEFIDVVSDFMRYRRRAINDLPEELLRQRDRIEKLQMSGESKRIPDHDLFYRIGVVLNRQKEPITMGELSKELGVPLSTATRIVDKLVDGSYAERVADPEDRRVVRVTLTTEGRELYKVLYKFVRNRIEHVLSRFSSDERKQLVYLLRKAASILDELPG